jgi:hypothetical protein
MYSGFIPAEFVTVEDADVYFIQTHSDPSNFGHMIIDDLFSAWAALLSTQSICTISHFSRAVCL